MVRVRIMAQAVDTESLSRRQFVQDAAVAGLGLLVGCGFPGQPAQRPPSVPRIGYLEFAPNLDEASWDDAFRQGLRELGYVEGQNIIVEWKAASSDKRLAELTAELV